MDLRDLLTADDMAQIAYLAILATVLVSYLLVSMRGRLNQFLRHAILWALLITGIAAAYGLWDNARFSMASVQSADGAGVVLRRQLDGQFHLTLELTGPNGQPHPVRFILDTGASDMVLTREDARKLGFGAAQLQFTGTARTANGVTRTARVRLAEVRLGDHVARDVGALVNDGDLHASLLGMRYLERFSRIEILGDRLRIVF